MGNRVCGPDPLPAVALTALALAAAIAAAPVAAEPPSAVELPLAPGGASWTPEQFAGAGPLALPIADLREGDAATPAPVRRAGRGGSARPPVAGVTPDLDSSLFDRALLRLAGGGRRGGGGRLGGASAVAGAIAMARGTRGLDFTSSRLLPPEARVFYPYSAVGRILFTSEGKRFYCSAAVISARIVVTAGHCLYSPEIDETHSDVVFQPAYFEGNAPFDTWEAVRAYTTSQWRDSDNTVPNPGDFGLIVIRDQDGERLGDVTGWLGFVTDNATPNHVTMIGYTSRLDRGQQPHQVTSSASQCCFTGTALYGSDMKAGSSGSPWIQNFGIRSGGQPLGQNGLRNRVVAVTSYSNREVAPRYTGGSIFSDNFVALIDRACAQAAGNCSQRPKAKRP